MKRIWVYDIEVLSNCHTATFLALDNQEVRQFVIHKSRNDFSEYIKFLQTEISGLIGFNNINYDYPVIHYLLNQQFIFDDILLGKVCKSDGSPLSTIDSINTITNFIYKKSNEVIDSDWSSIPEWKTIIPQLDLYRIWHFDNKAKHTSLKAVEIAIDLPNVADMPFETSHYVEDNEVQQILDYNLNDVLATYEFYKITIGDTDNPLYKGKDKLQLRRDIQAEFGINCINYNDVKIGDEINKLNYLKATGKKWEDIKNKNTVREIIHIKDCIPSFIKFESEQLQQFLESLKTKELLGTKGEFSEELVYKDLTLKFAQGGLHSVDKPRIVIPNENEILEDRDCASMYPTSIINFGLYPEHLGLEWLNGYIWTKDKRIEAKHLSKDNKKYEAIAESYKLALNGGGFGKTGEANSWQGDPLVTMKVTIGNQLMLLMLIEKYLNNDIQVISVNTDGIVALYNKDLQHKILEIDKWWEDITKHTLEYTPYKLFVQTSVNDYITVKTDGKVKYKGDYEIDREIHKNNSMRIVAMALKEYFINNIPVEETILNHTNIYHFCKRVKTTKGWWLEERFYDEEPIIPIFNNKDEQIEFVKEYGWIESGNLFTKEEMDKGIRLSTALNQSIEELKKTYQISNKLSKNVRYYVSTNGNTFIKCCEDGRETSVEKGYLSTVFNRYVEKPMSEYNINYDYYINECNKIIKKIKQ